MKMVNAPKKWKTRTIYVSNHPSAFLDPLVIADLQKPIIHFMVRSDVFKPALKPILWGAHMLPIYRSLDGDGALDKNEQVFETCQKLLKNKNAILLFGEGFTDDTFIRRLKPLKKGPVRIAFGAMEQYDWDFDLEIVCVGVNYTDPNQFRSDLLLSYSEPIKVNEYEERYKENPQQVRTEVTKRIEKGIKEQLTHYNNKNRRGLHEGIMRLSRKGMNHEDSDKSLSMIDRWTYSRNLANRINELEESKAEEMDQLQKEVDGYFKLIKKFRIRQQFIHEFNEKGRLSSMAHWLYLFLLHPFMIVGLIHNFLPYFITKRFVEGSFRRKVFWGGVKMMVGKVFVGIYNIPFIFLFYYFVFPSWWLAFLFYFSVPGITGVIAYNWFKKLRLIMEKNKIKKTKIDLGKFTKKQADLKKKIQEVVGMF